MKIWILVWSTIALTGFALAQQAYDTPMLSIGSSGGDGIFIHGETPGDWIFMDIHAFDHDKTANEKFFVGPLPAIGDAVEMVYIGDDSTGGMRFQLRTKAPK